ncbi:MAG: carboxypeptidase-like regulatory domain-containing protein [Acidobacteriota bacterium]|nr:carboxypeptidase-like regulatory domain-containing protein [Acidobacteriota bacterium]
MHNENGVLVDRTASHDFESRFVCAAVNSLSPFVVANFLAPTAANVSIGGRVTNERGRGIGRARVILTDGSGVRRSVTTNPFGYYRFTDVPAGNTYIFSVSHKSYQFSQPTQVVFADEERGDVNFEALP